jgi:signal transduction histidine kinase
MKNGEQVHFHSGDELMAEGSLPEAFYVVLEGDFEVSKRSNDQDVVLAIRGVGEMLGEMSLIEDRPRSATVRAVSDSLLLKISRDVFKDLLCGNATTALSILRTVMSRLRNTEVMLGQNEKLAVLGTLSAGLAHELNNPAAAAIRSAGHLRQTIGDWLRARGALDELNLDPSVSEIVVQKLRSDVARLKQNPLSIDSLTRSDLEAEIEELLLEYGLADAWEYTPSLVSYGWSAESLRDWGEQFEKSKMSAIIRWLATAYLVHNLIDEVNESTNRISEIVKAVKSYTYLDQAPIQFIDVSEGIENTLMILKHKLKLGVSVKREYDKSLPKVEAYASELNQVWTNILDNAIDAMKGQGEITLKTSFQNDKVMVEIADNGPGIPPKVLPHIFEPFYSTKDGKGTGLGLHISNNIVQKHRGKIEVNTNSHGTKFTVTLPIRLRK